MVDGVRLLLAVLEDDVVRCEAVGGGAELVEVVLREHGHAAAVLPGDAILYLSWPSSS